MGVVVTESSRDLDPRVRRTRRMLQDALARLLQTREFESISIGEIAEESTLNRATFYAHYPDKFALLDCLVAAQFQQVVEQREIRFEGCESVLGQLAQAVCYYLAERVRPGEQGSRQGSMPLETAIAGVVRRVLEEGFARHPLKEGVSAELVATALAWAIYGAAREWVQAKDRVPVETIAGAIGGVLTPILRAVH